MTRLEIKFPSDGTPEFLAALARLKDAPNIELRNCERDFKDLIADEIIPQMVEDFVIAWVQERFKSV